MARSAAAKPFQQGSVDPDAHRYKVRAEDRDKEIPAFIKLGVSTCGQCLAKDVQMGCYIPGLALNLCQNCKHQAQVHNRLLPLGDSIHDHHFVDYVPVLHYV